MPDTPWEQPEPLLTNSDIAPQKEFVLPVAVSRFERPALAAAVAFQLAVLIVMILGHTVTYAVERTILLKVVPVDPRDLFRGDYVILNYDISRIPSSDFKPGDSVYATLSPEADGRHFRLGSFLKAQPAGGVFIEGTAQNYGQATYGIESFYVQEATGHDYERAAREGTLSAEIALDGRGRAALRRLLVE